MILRKKYFKGNLKTYCYTFYPLLLKEPKYSEFVKETIQKVEIWV